MGTEEELGGSEESDDSDDADNSDDDEELQATRQVSSLGITAKPWARGSAQGMDVEA